ncbi:hypothetical protein J2S44_005937 [Catenuloplanes niger]|uniref:DUF4291 domain-containing protein n=1 Tax=Catenuloplanes niger TaxID=587534 RepID=A0AAE3ZTQ1_9ACTN|nr:hypothetical protein [Catenuloplanes niger]
MSDTVPARQVRAVFTDRTITVYQAYSPEIALPALAAGHFVPPFRPGRMTWIKPSFRWMMAVATRAPLPAARRRRGCYRRDRSGKSLKSP